MTPQRWLCLHLTSHYSPCRVPPLVSQQQYLFGGVGVASDINSTWLDTGWLDISLSGKQTKSQELYTRFTLSSASLFTGTQQKHMLFHSPQTKHCPVLHDAHRCHGPQAPNQAVTHPGDSEAVLAHPQGCEPLTSSCTNNSLMFKLKSVYLVLNSHTRDIRLTVWRHLLRKGATLLSPNFSCFPQAGK